MLVSHRPIAVLILPQPGAVREDAILSHFVNEFTFGGFANDSVPEIVCPIRYWNNLATNQSVTEFDAALSIFSNRRGLCR